MTFATQAQMDSTGVERGPSDAKIYALLVLMVSFWSLNFVIGKYALDRLPPLLLFGVRTLLAGLCILPVYLWRQRDANERAPWTWRERLTLVGLGALGVPLNQLLFVVGLNRTSASHAAISVAVTPVLVLMLASIAGHERITSRKVFGMLLALAGVTGIELARGGHGGGATFQGDCFIFLSSAVLALFTVFGKRLTRRYDGVTMFTHAYMGAGLAYLPMTLWEAARFPIASVGAVTWLSVIYMAVFPAIISYLLYYYALTYVAASRVSIAQCLQPVLATVLAAGLLGERLTATLLAGGSAVMVGVTITERG